MDLLVLHCAGKNVKPNRHLCTMSKHKFLADDKMANISLNGHTFIAQNLLKYHFQSSADNTFLSLSVSSLIIQRKICDVCHIWIEKWRLYSTIFPLCLFVPTVP